MIRFFKGISFFALLCVLVSCQDEEVLDWENAVITNEKDVMFISSFNFISLLEKSNLDRSPNLNFKQKMMLKAITSSFASSSVGIRVEGQHKIFVVPEEEEFNGGVFFPGSITSFKKFTSSLYELTGKKSVIEDNTHLLYYDDLNMMIAFDEKHFIVGSSYDSLYLKQKLTSYFNMEFNPSNDDILNDFLNSDDDFCFYFDNAKSREFIEKLEAPYLNTWLPILENYGDKVIVKTAFNKGNLKLSYFSNQEKTLFTDYSELKPFEPYFFHSDSSIISGMIDFNLDHLSSRYFDNSSALENDTAINYNIGKIMSEVIQLPINFSGQMAFSLKSLPNSSLEIETTDDWESESYWDDDDYEEVDSLSINQPNWLISCGYSSDDSNQKKDKMLEGQLNLSQSIVHKKNDFTFYMIDNDQFYFSNDSSLLVKLNLGETQFLERTILNHDSTHPLDVVFDVDRMPNPERILTFIPYSEYLNLNTIKNIHLTGDNESLRLQINFKEQNENALTIIAQQIVEMYLLLGS